MTTSFHAAAGVAKDYRPEVDGLRALAVLSVMFFHFQEDLVPNGYLGVDIFFVISGYVITRSLFKDASLPFGRFLLGFYARRIRRIVPALLACVVLTSLGTFLLNPEPDVSLVTGALSLFGVSNIYLFLLSEDYFAASSIFNSFTHTWSLGVEEQFYFIFPLMFWVCISRFQSGGRRYLSQALVAVSVVSLLAFVYFNNAEPMMAFYLTPMRFWELGAGCLLAVAGKGHLPKGLNVPAIPLLVLIATFFVPDLDWLETRRYVLTVISIAATAWLIEALHVASPTRRLFASTPVVYVGRISYSLYLWHWSVLSLTRWVIPVDNLVAIAGMVAATFVLAALSFHFVEQPIRKGRLRLPKCQVVAYGTSAASATSACLYLVTIVASPAAPPANARWVNDLIQHHMECHLPKVVDPLDYCLSRKTDLRTIFVVGDSHASNIVPSLVGAVKDMDIDIRYLADKDGFGSDEMKRRADYLAGQLRAGDVVMFSLYRNRLYKGIKFAGTSRKDRHSKAFLEDIEAGLRHLDKVVADRQATLVLVDDVPQICDERDFRVLVKKGEVDKCVVEKQISRDDRLPLTQLYRSLAKSKASYVDPHDALCSGNECSLYLRGRQLYGDARSHFTPDNPAPLAPFFRKWLIKNL